jgi:hypothetical protein
VRIVCGAGSASYRWTARSEIGLWKKPQNKDEQAVDFGSAGIPSLTVLVGLASVLFLEIQMGQRMASPGAR